MRKNHTFSNYSAYKNLQLLSSNELKEFGKWIGSDFCNSNKALRRLFGALKAHHPGFTHPKLTRAYLYGKMYPGKSLNDKVFLNSMSLLAKEVERFLVFQELQKDKKQFRRNFIKALNRRNATNRVIEESDRLTRETSQQEVISWEELPGLIMTQINLYYSDTTPFRQQAGVTPLQDAKYYLDIFHALATLKIDIELEERAKKIKRTKKEKRKQLRTACKNSSTYLTRRLYQSWRYNVNRGRPEQFILFRNAYQQYHDKIPKEDSQILWTYMLNQCSRQYQKGQVDMLAELLSLYKFGHQQDMLMHDETITETKFANIITVAVAEKDLSFAQTIHSEYSQALPKGAIEEGKSWAEAYILGYKQSYGKAISIIDGLSFKNGVFKPRSKVLRIQCFFEQFLLRDIDLDELLKACRAFERQMKKHYDLNLARSQAYLNFSKYLKKVARSYNDPNQGKKEIQQIQHQLKEATGIQVKKWMLDKMEGILEKGR